MSVTNHTGLENETQEQLWRSSIDRNIILSAQFIAKHYLFEIEQLINTLNLPTIQEERMMMMTYSNTYYSFSTAYIEFCQANAEESFFTSKDADSENDSLLDDSFPTAEEMLEMMDEEQARIEAENARDGEYYEAKKDESFRNTPSIAMVLDDETSFEDNTPSSIPTDDEIKEMILALSQRIKKNQDDLKQIGDRLGKVADEFREQTPCY